MYLGNELAYHSNKKLRALPAEMATLQKDAQVEHAAVTWQARSTCTTITWQFTWQLHRNT